MNPRPLHQVAGYRRLWLATAQIGLSSWMVQVGLFSALVSHYSASVMAVVLLMATIPALLAGPWVGNWLASLPGRAAVRLRSSWSWHGSYPFTRSFWPVCTPYTTQRARSGPRPANNFAIVSCRRHAGPRSMRIYAV